MGALMLEAAASNECHLFSKVRAWEKPVRLFGRPYEVDETGLKDTNL